MSDQPTQNLSALLRAVTVARSDVADARRTSAPGASSAVTAEQRVLLAALERYVAALNHRASPVPYRLRAETALYRSMFGTDGPSA